MLAGAIPFNNFKEKIKITKSLKNKYGKKIRFTINEHYIIYQINEKVKNGERTSVDFKIL